MCARERIGMGHARRSTKINKSINFVKYLFCAKYYGYKICFYNSELNNICIDFSYDMQCVRVV
jgi:hypothetical protein